ncbi:MAG TPA: transglutaminase-like domain-containing protein [Thermoanaerobaculia bacterium]|nr:transglutaminase-like domain-containing protein [Thermoanaerobaculia bacterium]
MRTYLPAFLLVLVSLPAFAAAQKTVDATYTATIANVPAGLAELKVWIPLPETRGWQRVSNVTIEAPFPFTRHTEKEFGNQYAFAVIQNPPAGDLTVRVKFTATRQEAMAPVEKSATRADLQRALRADKLVTVSPRLRSLANELTKGISDPYEQAHAIFNYLVVTMKYDKTIPGWGRGDSERMCDIKAGNCTDFHSLFMSLARAKAIPTRFVIGFPLTGLDGEVKGYHCWAEFYVKGKGWIPVDASDASKLKDPAAQQFLFGHLDPNRLQFTMGRDLVLSPRTSEPLNYFIYPRAEAAGKTVGDPSISLQFREVSQSASTSF